MAAGLVPGTYTIIICPTITLTPSILEDGTTGILYSENIQASGGTDPYVYTISSGQLPAGVFIDENTGVLSGVPSAVEDCTFSITATDANNCAGNAAYTISISENTSAYRATLEDQYNRLQHFMCCLGSKGAALAAKLRISTDCCCDINTFELLVMYWSVLVCYDPTVTTNCLTQAQIDAIWDDIACKCGICFNPYGSIYTSSTSGSRITEAGDTRITDDGETRIVD